jgi:hypothetical protein
MSRSDKTFCGKMLDGLPPRWLLVPDLLPFVRVSLRGSCPLPGLRLNKPAANDTRAWSRTGQEVKRLLPHFSLGRVVRTQIV